MHKLDKLTVNMMKCRKLTPYWPWWWILPQHLFY